MHDETVKDQTKDIQQQRKWKTKTILTKAVLLTNKSILEWREGHLEGGKKEKREEEKEGGKEEGYRKGERQGGKK